MDKLTRSDVRFWIEREYPLTIIQDRYMGSYSGGQYLAFPYDFDEIDEGVNGDDISCMLFWDHCDIIVGKGMTVTEAHDDLRQKMKELLQRMENGR